MPIQFIRSDGGRSAAGFQGTANDCVARAIAIASGIPYAEVYARLAYETGFQRAGKRGKRPASARNGINVTRKWFKDYMTEMGFRWVPTMTIGSGCRVHLRADDLPRGRLVVKLSRHSAAVINRVLFDSHDCSRGGTRCVYGYWILD